MADWPLLRNNRCIGDDSALPAYAATVTAAGAPNTKGAYVQLVAALPSSIAGILLEYKGNSAGYLLLDIARGPGGSETVVVPNLPINTSLSNDAPALLFVPVAIPAGTRIAARVQASVPSASTRLKMQFVADTFTGLQSPQRWKDWGAALASSFGTVLTSGAANTKGAWTQLVAASDFTTKWLILGLQANQSIRDFAVDLAVGGAGSEVVVIPDLFFDNQGLGWLVCLPFSIPGGSRIAARCASSTASSTLPFMILGGA